eukprot:c52356_g1_i1.p2 GENE.c52356_g1_i1~~c52356_g1_i1.p2  ORF type:complete len:112 (-),score=25.26 c52356_g1_i1:21-356(-)
MSRPLLELRNAERAAEQIVEGAKRDRTEKLRQARDQAREQVNALRAVKQDELRRYEAQHSGEVDLLQTQMAADNAKKDAEIQAAVAAHSEGIVNMLLRRVVEVRVDKVRFQ